MGKPIVYCDGCGKSLHEEEFDRGKARTIDNRHFCVECRPAEGTGTRRREAAASAPPRHTGTSRIPRVKPTARGGTAPGKSPTLLIVGGAVGLFIILALLALAFSRGSRSGDGPAPPEAPRRSDKPPAPPPAPEALQKARAFAAANPGDVAGQIRAWEQAVWACEKSEHLPEAKRELSRALEKRKEAIARELDELAARIRPLVDSERFQAAVVALDRERRRHEMPEWTAAVGQKIREAGDKAFALFESLRAQAVSARSKGAEQEVKAIRDRVQAWGLPEYPARLDEALAQAAPPAPRPPPPPPPPVPAGEVRELFNGKDLAGWTLKRGDWSVEDGALVGRGPEAGAVIATAETFGDYELTCSVTLDRKGYAEVQARDYAAVSGFNVEGGRAHQLRVVAKGPSVEVFLNGDSLNVHKRGESARGTVAFYVAKDVTMSLKDIRLRKP